MAPDVTLGPLARTVPVASGLVAALLLGTLLWVLAFEGWAHSFDTAIYVRSAWGAAHGDLWNPVRDLHVLSVHFNLVLFVLAPFVHALGATAALLLAQSVSFGVTVGAGARGFALATLRSGTESLSQLTAAVIAGAVLLIFSTPLLSNPFLFDLRPDAIGVPLLTIGLLRMWQRGDVDGVALAWLMSALIVREEYFMTIVGALAATPLSPTVLRRQWRLRLAGCVAAVAWWAMYFFGIRAFIGDGSDELAVQVAADFYAPEAAGGVLWEARARLVLAAIAGAGGLALIGWRWAAAAGPGLLFLLTVDRMPELLLNVHYSYFVAPGMVVAAVAGFERVRAFASERWRPGLLALPVAATIVFALCSAWPGGGVFRPGQFFVLLGDGADGRPSLSDRLALDEVYALLEPIPADAALAAPHEVAGRLAARETFVPIQTYLQDLSEGRLRAEIDWLVLPGHAWAGAGGLLVEAHGFRLIGVAGDRAALLTRDPLVPRRPEVARTDPECDAPRYRWEGAGLRLCRGTRTPDGQVHITLLREADAPAIGLRGLFAGPQLPPDQAVPALAFRGLLPPGHIDRGARATYQAAAPLGEQHTGFVLIGEDGRPLPVTAPDGTTGPAAPLP